MGVAIKPHYQALVREYVGERKIWSFAGRRGPYRKLNTATAACEYHLKVWTAAVQIAQGEFKGRADRIRALDGRARVGTAPFRGRVMVSVPIWIRRDAAEAHRIIKDTLFGKPCKSNDPDDQPEESKTSESSSAGMPAPSELTTPPSGPASSAAVVDEFATPPSEQESKGAKRAKAPAKPRKKPSKPSTPKKSASTEPKETSSISTPPSAAKRSRSSRKTRK